MQAIILLALCGIAVGNPHCRLNSDCPANYCDYPDYPFCDQRECNCLSPCKKDSDCDADKTIDSTGHRCSHSPRYCLSGKCHCGSDHLTTSDGTCPQGHTAECHNIACQSGSHLSCLNGVCTCTSNAVSGGCMTSSDCHSLQGCSPVNHHCVDRQCKCISIMTTSKPMCTTAAQCSIPSCIQSDIHCMDGKCACLTPTTIPTTTTTTTTTTQAPTTTGTPTFPGLTSCRLPTDCDASKCPNNNMHCIDGYCLCL